MSLKDEIAEATLDIDSELTGGVQAHIPACTHFLVGGKEICCIARITSVGTMALSVRQTLLTGHPLEVDLKDLIGQTLEFEIHETELVDQQKRKDGVKFRGKVERFADMGGKDFVLRRATVRVFDFIEVSHELRAVEPGREEAGAKSQGKA